MKKIIIAILVLAGIGVVYWLASPLFITREVNESFPQIAPASPESPADVSDSTSTDLMAEKREPAGPEIISQGMFSGLAAHNAEGAAKLLKTGSKYFVRFESDFKITNGPDLFVHFGKDGNYVKEARLAALKGNVGSQNYEVPADINPENYNEVWVWCRAFSIPFGKAELKEI